MKLLIAVALLALLGTVAAQRGGTCSQKERNCIRLCGSADAMDFQCESNQGAIVSSCACASVSGPITRAGPVSTSEEEIVPEAEWCVDVQPRGSDTCEQHKEYGNCDERWMIVGNYCRKTCFGCTCEDAPPPPGRFSCEQQAGWGKCTSAWMKGGRWCEKTCGACGVAPIA
eukprot:TRINITY_DN2663_c0_g1_i1.p2 TRINITY_DN2663_c0_g1~~TRINITY_DN2663_c0_g1_i1.p2  ORF type:complete len:171 (-),score=25.40 TRINITY_DN2663_c0_g1_i1:1027-1539(-)